MGKNNLTYNYRRKSKRLYFNVFFRSAKEAEDNIRKALQKGEVLPTEERFDSNCITPGIVMYCTHM